MARSAPMLTDLTPEEDFLSAISNPWRREVIGYCVTPQTKRDVFREFVCAGKNQRQHALHCVVGAGWLREEGDHYTLNPAAPAHLSHLLGVVVGQSGDATTDAEATDAAVAALRRRSCRKILATLEDGPVLFAELRAATGVRHNDFLIACTILKNAQAIVDKKPGYRLTGAGLPGLEGWLAKVNLFAGRVAA